MEHGEYVEKRLYSGSAGVNRCATFGRCLRLLLRNHPVPGSGNSVRGSKICDPLGAC
jgi:hypothetical protein